MRSYSMIDGNTATLNLKFSKETPMTTLNPRISMKYFAVVIAALAVALLFTACGGGGDTDPIDNSCPTGQVRENGVCVTPDIVGPNTAITSPAPGAEVQGVVAIMATATDPSGISRVDILVNGSVVDTYASSTCSYTWDTTTVADGEYTITVDAVDMKGNPSTKEITVTVHNTPPPAPCDPFQHLNNLALLCEMLDNNPAQYNHLVLEVTGSTCTAHLQVDGRPPGAYSGTANADAVVYIPPDVGFPSPFFTGGLRACRIQ